MTSVTGNHFPFTLNFFYITFCLLSLMSVTYQVPCRCFLDFVLCHWALVRSWNQSHKVAPYYFRKGHCELQQTKCCIKRPQDHLGLHAFSHLCKFSESWVVCVQHGYSETLQLLPFPGSSETSGFSSWRREKYRRLAADMWRTWQHHILLGHNPIIWLPLVRWDPGKGSLAVRLGRKSERFDAQQLAMVTSGSL